MIISIGMVFLMGDMCNILFVMMEVDKVLREVKSEGGNKVIIYYI